MELRLQPNPEVEIRPANKGIVSAKEYFVEKEYEEIRPYFFPGLLIRNWRPKAELIYPRVQDENEVQYECDFNRNVQSCFIEDNAEEVYLRTPPPCFVVFGKSSPTVRKLSKDIADEYGSVLIEVEEIVGQVLKAENETSKFVDKLLRLGISLTLNFVLALISFAAHTAEARHRGYVLCGLPAYPCQHDLSPEYQINYLFSWDNKPTVFVNVLFEDEDLVQSRTNVRCELETIQDKTRILFHSDYEQKEEEEEEEDDDDLESDEVRSPEPDIDISPSRPWVQLPKDEESQVWSELEVFDSSIKPVLDTFRTRIDPQYYITVDSRVHNIFEIIRARLRLLPIWKPPIPFPFIPPKEPKMVEESSPDEEQAEEQLEPEEELVESEEEAEIQSVIGEPPQIAFLKLFNKKTLSPKFRWELSHYNYICPVSLRSGLIVEGKSEFAVVFLKYIFFLRDEECMRQFLRNPRYYVLPVRPKPAYKFFVLGYPFCGKTTLAQCLAEEFSITLIDVNVVLRTDLEKKKTAYQEFCRQKAECREIIRLTARAWQDWRLEEEQRLALIETWIEFIQSLLTQRIEQFYSLPRGDAYSSKSSREKLGLMGEGGEQSLWSLHKSSAGFLQNTLEVRGVAITPDGGPYDREHTPTDNQSTPSTKIIQAMKHENYNFNENGLEVEANLFFSSLWNTFSDTAHIEPSKNLSKREEELKGEEEEEEEGNKSVFGELFDDRSISTINWCNLLPPQSLSSFLLRKVPYTVKERRESFGVLLEAAAKVYWEPSPLKTEFAKWRLPCFMDIPLCEVFLNNPYLLYRYCPDWLKERPLIPDSVDSNHPSVTEAGRLAFKRAGVVTVIHEKEEVFKLVRNAIEKVEREGIRVTGEVITPGGWVIDNMVLDQEVWCALIRENVLADYVYILTEQNSDPEHKRIINLWYDLHRQSESKVTSLMEITSEEESNFEDLEDLDRSSTEKSEMENPAPDSNLTHLLKESCEIIEQGDQELDEIYRFIQEEIKNLPFPFSTTDLFTRNFFKDILETVGDFTKEEISNEELTLGIQSLTDSSHYLFSSRQITTSVHNFPIGTQLLLFTNKIMDALKKEASTEKIKKPLETLEEQINFFVSLLMLPEQLEKVKELLNSVNRGETVTEIDIQGKTNEKIFEDIKKILNAYFLKKPRELESFEMTETMDELERKRKVSNGEMEDEEEGEAEEENQEEVEDICIYGESGPFCIVNLERDILLKGKPEFVLRYYGKLYFFYNQDAKDKFTEDPEKYAPYYSAIRCLPPLRIFIVGPVGSGKTSLAHAVANQCSINYVNYLSLLNNRLIPNFDPGCYKIKALTHNKLLLSEEHNDEAKEAISRFMNAPHEKRQFWLENPLENNEENMQKEIWENMNFLRPSFPTDYSLMEYKCIEPPKGEKFTPSEIEILRKNKPYISMNEIKEMLESYIENQTGITPYCIHKSLAVLWKEFPYVTQGFVLKGFPMRLFDVQYIVENNWIPDMIINISAPEQVVIERSLDDAMEAWKANLTLETQEEELLEDTLYTIQKTMISIRRVQLLNEKRHFALENLSSFDLEADSTLEPERNTSETETYSSERRGSTKGLLRYGDRKLVGSIENLETEKVSNGPVLPHGVEAKILAEVEEEVHREFPPMVFKAIYETPEAGKARIIADYELNYRRDVEELKKIKAALQGVDVPWYDIDSSQDLKKILNDLFIELDNLKRRYGERGEFAFTVKMSMAEKLLEQGYYFLSKFGKWCPVQVYRMKNSIHMYLPLESRGKIIPIVYRNYIYFVGGENEKMNFIEDPIKYTFNEPHHPNIPLRVAVIGPPKSGKSTLSSRLGLMFGLKVVTLGTAIRFVLENMSDCKLRREMDGYLKRGCFLPLSLKIEAIIACLNDPACVTQGFVFDGIPFDAALTQSLAEEGKLPFVILSLVCSPYFGKVNREELDLTQFRLPYKQRVNLDKKYAEWKETYERYVQWNQDTYNNLFELNAKLSVIDIFYQAYDIIKKAYFGILYYVEYCVTDKALPLQYLCISQHEWELRKSSFHSNCPVCWFELERLICSTDTPSRSGLVQFLNYFYWVCDNHMEKFLKEPKKYLPPNAPEPPKLIPKRINKSDSETLSLELLIHGNGRCPVTRVDFPDSLDWEGSWEYAASYDNEIFLCKNEEMLQRFMARPWRYCHADTKFEVNRTAKSEAIVDLGPPLVTSLPPIGFLEQTVADLIHQALQITGAVRPVYPGLTPTCSGCTFVGLYLKVHNKKNKTPHLEKSCLDFMLYYCQANKFRVPPYKTRRDDDIRDAEPEPPDSNDSTSSEEEEDRGRGSKASKSSRRSSVTAEQGMEPCWLDLESQADKKMWSAKLVNPNLTKMTLVDGKLEEASGLPKEIVVLRFQTYSMRPSPLPPITGCCTVLYSCKPSIQLPEKFNINTLYQPRPEFSSPHPDKVPFNPEKEFPHMLVFSDKEEIKSEFNLWKKQRCISDEALGDFIFPQPKGDPDLRFMIERFVPRFQQLDKIQHFDAPCIPKVIETKPIVFDPHRDYNYTLLMSEFFHLNRVLKCYEWDDTKYQLEFQTKVDKNLGLCNVRSQFFFHPEIKSSMKTLSSTDSYQKTIKNFQFFDDMEDTRPSSASVKTEDEKSSITNFIQSIIFHKLEQMFARLSISNLSYDSYETHVIATDSDSVTITRPIILIREIYPYPPLPWDIDSTPYYAYCSIPPLFDVFHMENIAHERHVSLLDGIREPYDRFKFVRYPTWVQQKETQPEIQPPTPKHRKSCQKEKDVKVSNPVYDYFNMHWTSFLTNPFAWDHKADIKTNFCGEEKDPESQSV